MENKLNPYISVDSVVFGLDQDEIKVLLLDRILTDNQTQSVIFRDLTLPGDHIYENEDIDIAAARILRELSGISNIFIEKFSAFGNPDRLKSKNDQLWLSAIGKDPSIQVVTVAYVALVRMSEYHVHRDQSESDPVWFGKNPQWYSLDQLGDLAFDHAEILTSGLEHLRNKVRTEPIIFQLLPEKFTLTQLQKLLEIILEIDLDKRNFRRKIQKMDFIVPLETKQTNVSHKPARLFRFDQERYLESYKNVFNFCGH